MRRQIQFFCCCKFFCSKSPPYALAKPIGKNNATFAEKLFLAFLFHGEVDGGQQQFKFHARGSQNMQISLFRVVTPYIIVPEHCCVQTQCNLGGTFAQQYPPDTIVFSLTASEPQGSLPPPPNPLQSAFGPQTTKSVQNISRKCNLAMSFSE